MKLKGTCNRCGVCCLDGSLRCANLAVTGAAGAPNGTHCTVYNIRYDGMPIKMIDVDGIEHEAGHYTCAKNSDSETEAIIEKGIASGVCSLKIA